MTKGGCVDGDLVTKFYGSPVPFIGLYIATGTLVCLFCMTFDLVYGLFFRKRPFIPCKLFTMNAFTMTVLAVAIKLPVDLTTSMPRVEDQLSKLTSTALLCTALGFYMPSLGTLGTWERYGNLAALSVMAITVIVNVCMQMVTGVIFAFTFEHIIIMFCISVLLLLMWSSGIALRGQKDNWAFYEKSSISEARDNVKDVQGLRKLLVKLHVLNYTGNPQTLLCETYHHHAFGLLCALSSALLLQAVLRSLVLKDKMSCRGGGVSDYRWSIPIVIVVQLLTIAVGTFSIIYRWLSYVSHSDGENRSLDGCNGYRVKELVILKSKAISFGFLGQRVSNVVQGAKDCIADALICIQETLYNCSRILGLLICRVKNFIIQFLIRRSDHEQRREDLEKNLSISVSEIKDVAFSPTSCPFHDWIMKMAMKEMMRWTNEYSERERFADLIQLIQDLEPTGKEISRSECARFIRNLEAIGKEISKRTVNPFRINAYGEETTVPNYFEYRVSCISVLVLSGMLAELMPSPVGEHTFKAIGESFEIFYDVDQLTTNNPSPGDQKRWLSSRKVWAQWENPKYWFRTEIISKFSLNKSEKSELQLHHVLEVLGNAYEALRKYHGCFTLATEPLDWMAVEASIFCEFIREQEYESVEDLFDFLEKCLAQMLCFFLSRLSLAILKEIDENDPTEIGEKRVRKAFELFCKLEMLGDAKIEWSWPSQTQLNQSSSTYTASAVDDDEDENDDDDGDGDDEDEEDNKIREIGADDVNSLVQTHPQLYQISSISTTVVAHPDSGCPEVEAVATASAVADDDDIRKIGPDNV